MCRDEEFQPIEFAPRLWRGRQPRGDEWEVLKSIGIKSVIGLNLLEEKPSFECRFHYLPMSSVFPPSERQVRTALWALCDQPPVFIHCKTGVDRTGFIVARWRMAEGWSREKAVEEMIRMGNHWWLRWWTWFL